MTTNANDFLYYQNNLNGGEIISIFNNNDTKSKSHAFSFLLAKCSN